NIRPMRLWQSLLFFMIPGLYGLFAQYVLSPFIVRLGMSEENAYNTVHLTIFIGLFLATIVALRVEGWSLRWASIKERLRIKGMDSTAWKLTLLFLVLYLVLGFLLNNLAQFVYEQIGFWPPDADIPLTNIPFLLIVFIANIFSEELWWRGYILPRQELEHGKSAWIVNGVLWSLFHISKWWAVPFMLLKQWMLPFVVQRTKNTTPAIVIHFVSNGASILLSILPLLTV
ncbi:MAG: CPBP family intramembrane metalloprotease, partial [Anaerolineaceae bacterium]